MAMVAGAPTMLSVQGQFVYGSDGEPRPNDELVQSVTQMLHKIDDGVGYVVFDDLGGALGLTGSKAFQAELTKAVWDEMIRRGWNPCARLEARLNMFEANDGSLPVEIVGDTVTYKKLHFDPHSIVFAHLYEPPVNLHGGAISLVDVRRYLDVTRLRFDEVFRMSRQPGHDLRRVARQEHHDALLREYATVIHPPEQGRLLLVMVRNDPHVGVAHEIGAVHAINPGEPTARRFFRTSVAPHH
jgi:hypothetical protein